MFDLFADMLDDDCYLDDFFELGVDVDVYENFVFEFAAEFFEVK